MLTLPQIAIAKFFDGEQPDPVAEAQAAQAALSSTSPPPTQARRTENLTASLSTRSPISAQREPAPRIVPQPESQKTWRPPLLIALLLTPFNLLTRLVGGSFSLIGYLLSFLPRLVSGVPARSLTSRSRPGRKTLNSRDAAARFAREFEEDYGRHDLQFFEGSYASAYDLAKKDLRFLLVVLISPEHDDTTTFVHETLLSPDVVSYVNDSQNNILLWAGNVQDSEAYQVSTALNCSKFPFAALVAHTPQDSSTSMSTIARIAGLQPPSAFIAKLRAAITEQAPVLNRIRTQRNEQQATRSLREEQNTAYERSLAQDRERARQRREAEALRVRAEKEAKAEEEAAEKEAQSLEQWRQWRAQTIPPEPAPDAVNVTRVSVRMTSGKRLVRRFAQNADIEELYAFVECCDVLSSGEPAATVLEPTGYKHKYRFRLVSPMPRIVYDVGHGGAIGEKIGRSANLIIEPIDEDEERDV